MGGLASPAFADAPVTFDDPQSAMVMHLLNAQGCGMHFSGTELAQAQVSPSPSPGAGSPSPSASPSFRPVPVAPGQPYATPQPASSPITPPPIPSPTPVPSGSPGPVYLVTPQASPSISPARPWASASPSPTPLAAPTLRPGYVAVMADHVKGASKPGIPGDATGNVHIFYQDEVLVGDRAHYDGARTITVTGNPYIIDNSKDSVLYADEISFDVVAQKAQLIHGRGESSQGVEQGLVYFGAQNMKSDEHGVAKGEFATVTTCANPRGGYHITGRTIDVIPSDRIVISKAVLWLGAAAIFYLPRVVIPLRTVTDERMRPHFFPEIGYNHDQGFYVRARLGFGHDVYYYGYYTIEFYTRQGTTLGYTGTLTKKNGKRSTSISAERIQNRLINSTQYNAAIQDQENFSQYLRGLLAFSYQGNYGPLVNLPASTQANATVTHAKGTQSQSYTFTHGATAGQANNDQFGFADSRSFGLTLQNSFTANVSTSSSTYGGFTSSNHTGSVNDLLHWATPAMDYQMTYEKTFARDPFGINKEPELQVRPTLFLPHFVFPIAPTLAIGLYNEPQTPETTSRADLGMDMGPLLYRSILGDFSATFNVNQYAYGTGDLKASISQQMSLNTPIGSHISNNITYNEGNFNGPGTVPFSTIDLQNSPNFKNASDILRFFNADVYNLSFAFTTAFNGMAQPVAYSLAARPSRRSFVQLQGTFYPGPGQGFNSTNVQFSTPFGRGSWLQFLADVDWKNKAAIINKSIYYSHIVGDCYEIQVQYNQNSRTINVTLSLLAFPSHAASFGLTTTGSIIPTSFNGYYP